MNIEPFHSFICHNTDLLLLFSKCVVVSRIVGVCPPSVVQTEIRIPVHQVFFLSIVGDLKSPKAIQYEYNIYVEHIKGKVNFLFFAFFMTQHNLLRSIFKDLNT